MAKKKTKKKVLKSDASVSTEDTKLSLTSMNILEDRKEQLKALFPEVFAEDQIDFKKLKAALGKSIDDRPERYGLNWAGKREAFHNVQTLSTGTLRPAPDESVNFDSTENLIIEGDNLEVLKLLQKSYYGKIKMIYIDPPYNTGNEFIYPDDFREGLQTYLRYTKQVNEEGVAQTTNKETSGRFHSIWMNMMYPRLYLARNLLREDGLIFISIDDNELHNMVLMLNEIFGEENFLAKFIWVNEGNIDNQSRFKRNHEYVILYARNEQNIEPPPAVDPNIPKTSKIFKPIIENTLVKNGPANPVSELILPKGFPANFEEGIIKPGEVEWPKFSTSVKVKNYKLTSELRISSGWSSKDLFDSFIKNKMMAISDSRGQNTIFYITKNGTPYLKKDRLGKPSHVLTVLEGMGTVQSMSSKLTTLGISFDYPKPIELLSYLIKIGTSGSDIILDFFAGCGTTAHAALDLNRKEQSDRKFILVQLPEPIDNSELPTISDLCKEHIRRVIKFPIEATINSQQSELPLEQSKEERKNEYHEGFKVLKLDSSNFSLWDGENAIDPEQLDKQLRLYADHVKNDRSQLDILYEILIKTGFQLTVQIEEQEIGKLNIFNIESGELIICLEDKVTQVGLSAIVDTDPRQVICLDSAFQHNDQLKTNTVLEMKSNDITFHTV